MNEPQSPDGGRLPVNRLTTTDQDGRRLYVYPVAVEGFFRRWRDRLHAVLLLVLVALPWLRINGHPIILLDLPRRKFAFFGVAFWAHDAPYLVFVLAGLALLVSFVTLIWGRIWCGWACPQIVFVDSVYRRIETWTEGIAQIRKRRDQGAWSADKLLRKLAKWILFLAVSWILANTFLAYFVGTDELLKMIARSPDENPSSFFVMMFATALTAFDFGWFREQFCTIMCPYGRLQSVLMDSRSLVIHYDEKRGEPRRGFTTPEKPVQGDCINCQLCVEVCPTGIDIRRGQQLECVACTACIDACDGVMLKNQKPEGLIRYDRLDSSRHWLDFRAVIYLSMISIAAGFFIYLVKTHTDLHFEAIRAIGEPYEVAQGQVTNHFKVDLGNQTFDPLRVTITLIEADVKSGVELVMPPQLKDFATVPLEGGRFLRSDLWVRFPRGLKRGHLVIKSDSGEIQKVEVSLLGPL